MQRVIYRYLDAAQSAVMHAGVLWGVSVSVSVGWGGVEVTGVKGEPCWMIPCAAMPVEYTSSQVVIIMVILVVVRYDYVLHLANRVLCWGHFN